MCMNIFPPPVSPKMDLLLIPTKYKINMGIMSYTGFWLAPKEVESLFWPLCSAMKEAAILMDTYMLTMGELFFRFRKWRFLHSNVLIWRLRNWNMLQMRSSVNAAERQAWGGGNQGSKGILSEYIWAQRQTCQLWKPPNRILHLENLYFPLKICIFNFSSNKLT